MLPYITPVSVIRLLSILYNNTRVQGQPQLPQVMLPCALCGMQDLHIRARDKCASCLTNHTVSMTCDRKLGLWLCKWSRRDKQCHRNTSQFRKYEKKKKKTPAPRRERLSAAIWYSQCFTQPRRRQPASHTKALDLRSLYKCKNGKLFFSSD